MPKHRTRMTDIAEHAQVSTATVSRVINGTGPVSAETRHRVLTAIDSLGYERPLPERSSSTPCIGIIIPELTNPIFAAYAHAIQAEVSRTGAIPLICSQTPGSTSEGDYVQTLLSHGCSGLIFVSGRHADFRGDMSRYHHLRERRIPFVTINGSREEIESADFSAADQIGISIAVRHLRELGHTRIALLSGRTHIVPASRKVDAFKTVMAQEFGIDKPRIVETFYTYEAAAAATHGLLDEGMTALVTGSDMQALGAIRAAKSRGMRVPDDLSVVGFDDSQLMAHLDPPLTTIRQPVDAITTAAVRTLFEAIKNPDMPATSGAFLYTPDLVVRGSTGRAPSTSR